MSDTRESRDLNRTSNRANATGLSRAKRVFFSLLGVLAVPALVLLVVEGASSYLLVAQTLWSALGPGSRSGGQLVQPDTLLGWVSRPNLHVADRWGPGVWFQTNSRRFRNHVETTTQPAEGQIRIVCSGDSFTEGIGVANDQTWCALLAAKDSRLEGVNLGQLGYGLDQGFLRYERDGRSIRHALHILAFITDDFRRMELRRSWHWKPRLAVQNGHLQVHKVPAWLARLPRVRVALDGIQDLRTVYVLGRIKEKLKGGRSSPGMADSGVADVVRAIVARLRSAAETDNTIQLLVFLPMLDDYVESSDVWRAQLHAMVDVWRARIRGMAAPNQNLWYIDLISEFRRLPPDSAKALFIPYQGEDYERRGFPHYSVYGNQWVADHLHQSLASIPGVGLRLQGD